MKLTYKYNGKKIEQTEIVKYLEVKIHERGTSDADKNENASKVYQSIKNTFTRKKEVSRKTEMTVFNTVYYPILIYNNKHTNRK